MSKMPKWKLTPPPLVRQGAGYKCWAAALASWCYVTPYRKNWTQEELLEKGEKFAADYVERYMPGRTGAINADIFKRLLEDPLLSLRMDCEEVAGGAAVDTTYFYRRLVDHGHLYVVYTTPNGVRHANVVYTASGDGDASVMDPMYGYVNKAIEEFRPPFLLAWAGSPNDTRPTYGF